ncbi:serine hydrolase [Henriciella sp. AS95]|uniref:serine hydrolase n=1 Tax=Henriciella sp. AS95 TaxID=3135782 RepID=UPI00316C2ADE
MFISRSLKILRAGALALGLGACTTTPASESPAPDLIPSDDAIRTLMQQTHVPGLSIARLSSCQVTSTRHFGVEDVETRAPVTADTAFEAASLTKTVFATLVMSLANEGVLDLDEPLADTFNYARIPNKALYARLTPRLILQHRSGLPNWASDPTDRETWGPIEFNFEPGRQFNYSGEAFQLLQAFVEDQTGKSLDLLFRERYGASLPRTSLSKPLDGMSPAFGHDASGSKQDGRPLKNPPNSGAAFSMTTTADDYAAFLAGLCGNDSLTDEMWTPASPTKSDQVTWALGWGVQTGKTPIIFHWGDNGPFKAFAALEPQSGDGIVFFANGMNGLTLIESLAEPIVGDLDPIIDWLDYGRPADLIEAEPDALAIDRLPADYAHNGGETREPGAIDMIVIHTIGGPLCEAGEIHFADVTGSATFWRDWFFEQDDKSIHYIIGRDGAIAQQRPDLRTAGHVSFHGVRENVNTRSIGIELVNNGDGEDPFPAIQIASTKALVKKLSADYSLGAEDIFSHSDLDPRQLSGCGDNYRRVDPGPLFPMADLKASLAD